MFNPHITKPETLVERFKDDWNLLKEIYFKLITYDKNMDYTGVFLITFAKFYPSFIDEYIEFTVMKKSVLDTRR
jgi:hypothetical protein